jgi:Tat protein secretion system quality control protein TatD with DNase activity
MVRTSSGSQLVLAKKYHLPLFLHSRAAHDDFVQILREEGFGEDGGRAVGGRGGVVHSFTGSIKDANDYVCTPRLEHSRFGLTERHIFSQVKMGFHIGFVVQWCYSH